MSKVVNLRNNDERLDIASRWIFRMDQGLSPAEEAELQAWMGEDPKNVERLLSMAKRWDKMQDLSRLAELFPEPDVNGSAKRGRTPHWAAAAAIVVFAVAAGGFGLWFADFTDQSRPDGPVVADNTFETSIGEQSTITLEDGSTVVLNTNTLMRVRYSSEARIVELERGEIHIDVVSIADRPFSVVVGDRILQALGTSFSVEITDDQHIELIVTEGKVIVGAHPPGKAAPTVPLLMQSSDNAVAAGEEVLLGSPNQAVTPVSAEEIEVRLSWRDGRLIFNDKPLEQALAEVERYTTVQFVFIDEDLKARTVTGRFRTGDVEGLLIALRMNFDIVHERADDGRVLLSSL